MSDKNGKAKLWVYAVVLFSSAFIVLLLTAYSQIRMNLNINNYKNKIYNTQTEKNKFMTDFKTASRQLESLQAEINKLKENMDAANKEIERLKDENNKLKQDSDKSTSVYEWLMKAEKEYEKGNIVECAEILRKELDVSGLSTNGQDLYNGLKEKTFKKAALLLYKEGYNYYKKGTYSAAEKNFFDSIAFTDVEYFSDDCYFLTACSEYRLGNMESVKGYLHKLVDKYPDSNYYKDAEMMLKQLE